jgi:hypothetical protein
VAAEVYKVKQDISIERAIREAGELVDGTKQYETEGINYPVGSYVLAKNISPPVRERVENGELDAFLEEASGEEAEAALALGDMAVYYSTFIPQHEVEAYYLNRHGHTVVPRDQELEMKSAGADQAQANLEAAKEAGLDERPNLTAPDTPSLAEVSRGEAENVPQTSEHVDVPEGTQQPPGMPIGPDLAAAEGGDEKEVEKAQKAASRKSRRKKSETPDSPGQGSDQS